MPIPFVSRAASNLRTHRHFHESVLPHVHPQHLFNIITDVDRYVEFLPLCTESRILQRSQCGTMFDAVLEVGWPPLLKERYVSRVRATAGRHRDPSDTVESPARDSVTGVEKMNNTDECKNLPWIVESKSIRSTMFESLKSRWQLNFMHGDATLDRPHGLPDKSGTYSPISSPSCEVRFEVEMSVTDPIISATLNQVLRDVADKQVNAFERRCAEMPFKY